jgi:hypothetical protein
MYTSIRHYTFKNDVDRKSFDDYIGRIENKFVPGVQALPGFHSYYLVKLRENEIVGIGIFEDKSSADASSRWAAGVRPGRRDQGSDQRAGYHRGRAAHLPGIAGHGVSPPQHGGRARRPGRAVPMEPPLRRPLPD